MPEQKQPDRRRLSDSFSFSRSLGPLLSAGIQLAASVVLMFFLGRWLDGKLGTGPWLMLAGAMIGIGGGLYAFIKAVNEAEELEKDDSDTPKS